MKILIIGGTGTISSPLVRRALAAGHEATLLNRGNRPIPEGVEHLAGDRNEPDAMKSLLSGRRFDATIDMMSFQPGQLEMLCQTLSDPGHLVFCSTVCALGFDWETWPVGEKAPCRPNSDYGRGKAAAEQWLRDYGNKTGQPYSILRPSTTYDHRTGLIRQTCLDGFRWLGGLRESHPLIIADGGMGLNQFLHADDCSRAFLQVLGQEQCFGKTYHVVGPVTSWEIHHRTAMRVLGGESSLISASAEAILEAQPDNPIFRDIFQYHGIFSGTALEKDIGFHPEISLESGMRQVIEKLDELGKIPEHFEPESWEAALLGESWQGSGE